MIRRISGIDDIFWKFSRYKFERDSYEALRASAKVSSDFFLARFAPSETTDSNLDQLNEWVNSSEGQQILTKLVEHLACFVKKYKEWALPAHDLWQILSEDLRGALRFVVMEELAGAKASSVIPAGFHDVGRLVEGFFYDPEFCPLDKGIPHAQLSFLIFQEILALSDFDLMPSALKDHYLYAVLAHSGDNGKSFMAQVTQACDRGGGLVGANGLVRALGFLVCLMRGGIAYPAEERFSWNLPNYGEHASVLMELEFFARNMRENIGEKHAVYRREIAVQNVALLLLACANNKSLKKRIFAPECVGAGGYGAFKKKIAQDIWGDATTLSKGWIQDSLDGFQPVLPFAATLLDMLQAPEGAAILSDEMKGAVHQAVREIPFADLQGIYHMALKAEELRDQGYEQDMVLMESISADQSMPPYIRKIAEGVYSFAKKQSFIPNPAFGMSLSP